MRIRYVEFWVLQLLLRKLSWAKSSMHTALDNSEHEFASIPSRESIFVETLILLLCRNFICCLESGFADLQCCSSKLYNYCNSFYCAEFYICHYLKSVALQLLKLSV